MAWRTDGTFSALQRLENAARSSFPRTRIQPGDTLLILGDEKSGIIVTRPEVVSDMARRVFQEMEEEK